MNEETTVMPPVPLPPRPKPKRNHGRRPIIPTIIIILAIIILMAGGGVAAWRMHDLAEARADCDTAHTLAAKALDQYTHAIRQAGDVADISAGQVADPATITRLDDLTGHDTTPPADCVSNDPIRLRNLGDNMRSRARSLDETTKAIGPARTAILDSRSKKTLTATIVKARRLLADSNNRVADPKTRTTLAHGISMAGTTSGHTAMDRANTEISKAMRGVSASMTAKTEADRRAMREAREAAEQARRAAEQAEQAESSTSQTPTHRTGRTIQPTPTPQHTRTPQPTPKPSPTPSQTRRGYGLPECETDGYWVKPRDDGKPCEF